MRIDCSTWEVRGRGCDDCVVSVLLARPRLRLAGPQGGAEAVTDVRRGPRAVPLVLDEQESAAIANLAAAGLVPPLRLVTGGVTRADMGTDAGIDTVMETAAADGGRSPRVSLTVVPSASSIPSVPSDSSVSVTPPRPLGAGVARDARTSRIAAVTADTVAPRRGVEWGESGIA